MVLGKGKWYFSTWRFSFQLPVSKLERWCCKKVSEKLVLKFVAPFFQFLNIWVVTWNMYVKALWKDDGDRRGKRRIVSFFKKDYISTEFQQFEILGNSKISKFLGPRSCSYLHVWKHPEFMIIHAQNLNWALFWTVWTLSIEAAIRQKIAFITLHFGEWKMSCL